MSEQDTTRAKTLLDNFNALPDHIQDKLLNGVKCLEFLQNLADIKSDTDKREQTAQAV